MSDLTADSVKNKLVSAHLHPDVKRALELRQLGSLTSVAKYDRFQELQKDGRIRNSIIYHGSSTGRFAGRGAQLMNLPRGSVEVTTELIERVLERGEGGTLPELSSLVRSVLKAPEGYLFADCDYSSIENRLGVWVAGQEDKLENFRAGLDEYKQFCSESLYKIPYDSVTKQQRQTGKTAVLGCLYGLGYRGLTQYAAGFGVHMDEEEAKRVVDAYRVSYSRVKSCWAEVEKAAMNAIKEPGNVFRAGKCNFKVQSDNLWVQLPSKRLIRWSDAKIEKKLIPGWSSPKDTITVNNQNTFTRVWGRNDLGGPSIYQSIVQALGRDILVHAMLELDRRGYSIVQIIHDQIVTLIEEGKSKESLCDIISVMETCPDWLTDFPLACEGFTSKRFSK
jgi:DNA polymerase